MSENKKLEKKAELKKQIRHTHSESVTKKIMQWYKPLKKLASTTKTKSKTDKKQAPAIFKHNSE